MTPVETVRIEGIEQQLAARYRTVDSRFWGAFCLEDIEWLLAQVKALYAEREVNRPE